MEVEARCRRATDPAPGALDAIRELAAARELIAALVGAELKLSVRGAALHYFWWLLEPALMMLVYAFVLTIVLDRGHDRTWLFLLCALLPWKATSAALQQSASSLRDAQAIIRRVAFPRAALPVAMTLTQGAYMLVGLAVLALVALARGELTPQALWLWPLAAALQLTLTAGLAMVLAALGAWYKDTLRLVSLGLQVWFFGSPALYALNDVPPGWRELIGLNPMTGVLEASRAAALGGPPPEPALLAIAGLGAGLALALGAAVSARSERRLAKAL